MRHEIPGQGDNVRLEGISSADDLFDKVLGNAPGTMEITELNKTTGLLQTRHSDVMSGDGEHIGLISEVADGERARHGQAAKQETPT